MKEKEKKVCRICGVGALTPYADVIDVFVEGVLLSCPSYLSVCDFCGSEQADAEQVSKNKYEMLQILSEK